MGVAPVFLVTRHLPCLLACEPPPPPKCRTTEPPGSRVRHIFDSTLSSTQLYTLSPLLGFSRFSLISGDRLGDSELDHLDPPSRHPPFSTLSLSTTFNKNK